MFDEDNKANGVDIEKVFSSEEILDVYDENLNIIGIKSRKDVHKYGLKHKVVQCYIVRKEDMNKYVYFQQRSFKKSNYPGLYDIACAGHIDSGEKTETSMVRELIEEVGIYVDDNKLINCGIKFERKDHDDILDDEICQLYVLEVFSDKFDCGDEVENMVKVSFEEYKKWVNHEIDELKAICLDNNEIIKLNNFNICDHIRENNNTLIKIIENI